MYLAYFIVLSLDLLDSWHAVTNEAERKGYADWIYHCQHPQGGFRMWPGTDFGVHSNEENAKWDPANMCATYFALSTLLIMGDDMSRVKRRETLRWLQRMQRPDGSFGETLVDGRLEGGSDPRFSYCATGARFILHGGWDVKAGQDDIDVDALVTSIHNGEVRPFSDIGCHPADLESSHLMVA